MTVRTQDEKRGKGRPSTRIKDVDYVYLGVEVPKPLSDALHRYLGLSECESKQELVGELLGEALKQRGVWVNLPTK